MVKPLQFKGEKKRKRRVPNADQAVSSDRTSTTPVVTPSDEVVEEDDCWVTAEASTDISGPIILALPSMQPTCIACDASGKVFASKLENIIEGNLATAEPHDVRQVWIASKVAGTESISFKSHHGRYLSCDNLGLLSASHEAISSEESFLCIAAPGSQGIFSVQTERQTFLAISENAGGLEIRGGAEAISFSTTLSIRMQARFKPKLKANKESKAREKISRKELEEVGGRKLDDEEVRRLKRARVQGDYHEAILNLRVKGKHDKYS